MRFSCSIFNKQNRSILSLFMIISLLLLLKPLYGETVFGGTLVSEYYYETSSDTNMQDVTITGNFLVTVYKDTFTFRSEMRLDEQMLVNDQGFEHSSLSLDYVAQAISVSSFTFDFYALENVTISIGKFSHTYGQSEIFNPLGVFNQTEYAQLLKGNLSSSQAYPFILKASLFSDILTMDVLIAPFIPQYIAFPLDSSFFPRKDIPTKIDMGGAGIKTLDTISYTTGNIEDQEAPFSLLLGFSKMIQSLDVSVFGFYGWDSDYPLTTTLSFETETFSIFLKPTYQKCTAFGLSLASTHDRLRVFADMLYTPKKLFSTNWYTFHSPYAATTLQQEQVFAQSLAYNIGMSIDLPELQTFLQVEYYDQFISQQKENNIADQLFSQMLSSIINSTSKDGKLIFRLISLYSLSDSSTAIFTALHFDFSEEFSLAIKSPLFLGVSNSSFGQFKDINALAISCQIRF